MYQVKLYRALALAASLLMAASVSASPLFSIGEGGDKTWQQALTDGDVIPVDPAATLGPGGGVSSISQNFYFNEFNPDPFQYYTPTLSAPSAPVSDGSEAHDSLVMSWGDNAAPGGQIAQWDYVYDVDPDLTGTKIHFSLYPPPGIWDVSIELFDDMNRSRAWFIQGPLPAWGNFWIDPSDPNPQGPFNVFFETPGFDITKVLFIRFDEAGSTSLPVPPIDPTGNGYFWNAWNHVRVEPMVPEPAVGVLLLMGTGMLTAGRRRRRSR